MISPIIFKYLVVATKNTEIAYSFEPYSIAGQTGIRYWLLYVVVLKGVVLGRWEIGKDFQYFQGSIVYPSYGMYSEIQG